MKIDIPYLRKAALWSGSVVLGAVAFFAALAFIASLIARLPNDFLQGGAALVVAFLLMFGLFIGSDWFAGRRKP
jgi:hypothetical protein